jgi:hypothetical protein
VKRLKSDIWTRLSVLEERTSIGSSDSRKSSLLSEQTDGEGAIKNIIINILCRDLSRAILFIMILFSTWGNLSGQSFILPYHVTSFIHNILSQAPRRVVRGTGTASVWKKRLSKILCVIFRAAKDRRT